MDLKLDGIQLNVLKTSIDYNNFDEIKNLTFLHNVVLHCTMAKSRVCVCIENKGKGSFSKTGALK